MGEAKRRAEEISRLKQTNTIVLTRADMRIRLDPKTYAEQWEKESTLFGSKDVYKRLSEITPNGNVLEIGSGIGLATLELAASRKILALDNNVHLAEKARSRLEAIGAKAEVVVANIFEPSAQCIKTIKEFAPKIIVGWFFGSNADDQEKYVASDVPPDERPKKYREKVEDAMFTKGICPPSVEWIHLAIRAGMIDGVPEDFANQETKTDYDTHVFLPNGFEVVDVQMLDWDTSGSGFEYGAASNPNLLQGQSIARIVSVLAKRKDN
jgi:hypothetical protein